MERFSNYEDTEVIRELRENSGIDIIAEGIARLLEKDSALRSNQEFYKNTIVPALVAMKERENAFLNSTRRKDKE